MTAVLIWLGLQLWYATPFVLGALIGRYVFPARPKDGQRR